MKKLKLDTGVVSYQIGGGTLRFHPGDPNVYMRFQQALEKLEALEKRVQQAGPETDVLQTMYEVDKTLKSTLDWVFGPGNDFDGICGGVNLLSADEKGERLITKLLAALEPVLLEGARQCASSGQ